jgi:hypothetical protein
VPFSVDVDATIEGLDRLSSRVDEATGQITEDALKLFQASGRVNAPIGTEGNTTNEPGDLKESIVVLGPYGIEGEYEGEVGPTVIYGRQRELGGPIFKFDGFMVFHWGARGWTYAHQVEQEGAHYMLKGYIQVRPSIPPLIEERLTAAILGTQ